MAVSDHDLFLVVPDHNSPESSQITVALYNGTFDTNENTIDRERMLPAHEEEVGYESSGAALTFDVP